MKIEIRSLRSMYEEELISIIIPIYNTEKYLEECIESVIKQTYKNLEIILVDDGSTDSSLEICNKYQKKDKRIKLIYQENSGVSVARNVGIEMSTGRYIGFVDSDDFIEEDMYEQLYKELKKEKADIVGCDAYVYDTLKMKKSNQYITEKRIMNTEEALMEMNQLGGFGIGLINKLYKREMFDEIVFPKGKTHEDWFMLYKILEKAKKIVYNPIAKYYYRQRSGSITKSNTIDLTAIEAATEILNFTKKKYPNVVVSSRYAYIMVNLSIYNQMLKHNYSKKNREKIILNIKKEKKGVLMMKNIKLYKKLQILCICSNRTLYDFIIKIKLKKQNINF